MKEVQHGRMRYVIHFDSRWGRYATFFAGLSIFLLCAFFYGLRRTELLGEGAGFGTFWMPIAVLTVFGVLMCGIRLNNPLPYGVLGVIYCLYMLLYSATDGVGSSFLAVVWYILAALVLMAAVLNLFPGKLLVVVMFLLPVIYRVDAVAIDYITAKNYIGFLPEAAALSGLLVFAAFGGAMKKPKVNMNSKTV